MAPIIVYFGDSSTPSSGITSWQEVMALSEGGNYTICAPGFGSTANATMNNPADPSTPTKTRFNSDAAGIPGNLTVSGINPVTPPNEWKRGFQGGYADLDPTVQFACAYFPGGSGEYARADLDGWMIYEREAINTGGDPLYTEWMPIDGTDNIMSNGTYTNGDGSPVWNKAAFDPEKQHIIFYFNGSYQIGDVNSWTAWDYISTPENTIAGFGSAEDSHPAFSNSSMPIGTDYRFTGVFINDFSLYTSTPIRTNGSKSYLEWMFNIDSSGRYANGNEFIQEFFEGSPTMLFELSDGTSWSINPGVDGSFNNSTTFGTSALIRLRGTEGTTANSDFWDKLELGDTSLKTYIDWDRTWESTAYDYFFEHTVDYTSSGVGYYSEGVGQITGTWASTGTLSGTYCSFDASSSPLTTSFGPTVFRLGGLGYTWDVTKKIRVRLGGGTWVSATYSGVGSGDRFEFTPDVTLTEADTERNFGTLGWTSVGLQIEIIDA